MIGVIDVKATAGATPEGAGGMMPNWRTQQLGGTGRDGNNGQDGRSYHPAYERRWDQF
jgi:hypothetical protein